MSDMIIQTNVVKSNLGVTVKLIDNNAPNYSIQLWFEHNKLKSSRLVCQTAPMEPVSVIPSYILELKNRLKIYGITPGEAGSGNKLLGIIREETWDADLWNDIKAKKIHILAVFGAMVGFDPETVRKESPKFADALEEAVKIESIARYREALTKEKP